MTLKIGFAAVVVVANHSTTSQGIVTVPALAALVNVITVVDVRANLTPVMCEFQLVVFVSSFLLRPYEDGALAKALATTMVVRALVVDKAANAFSPRCTDTESERLIAYRRAVPAKNPAFLL